jgi:hypothetical protein
VDLLPEPLISDNHGMGVVRRPEIRAREIFRNTLPRIGPLFLLTMVLAVSGAGQTSKGTIAGTILDSTGAAIAGAQVTAKDTHCCPKRGQVCEVAAEK